MASEEEAAEMMDTLKDLNLSKDVRICVFPSYNFYCIQSLRK